MIKRNNEPTVLRIRMTCTAAFLFSLCLSSAAYADTQWDVGVSGDKGGIEGFHVSVGEYYHVPERDVVRVRDRGIPDEEIPVVFHIARSAHVSPRAVVDLRIGRMGWLDITVHFGLKPDLYYVPVTITKQGPPYGKAYGYYKKHPKGT